MTNKILKDAIGTERLGSAIMFTLSQFGEEGLKFNPVLRPVVNEGKYTFSAVAMRLKDKELQALSEVGLWVPVSLWKGGYNYVDPVILSEFILAHDVFDE